MNPRHPGNRRRALVWAGLLWLSACAGPQIYHGQLSALDKGMGAAQVAARLAQPPLSVHSAGVAGRRFDFQRYQLNNGVHSELYLLAFEQDRLLFWGYVSEFRRQPDADLSQATGQVLRDIASLPR